MLFFRLPVHTLLGGCKTRWIKPYATGLWLVLTRGLAGNLKLGGLEIFFQHVTNGDFLKITVYKKW